MLLPCVRESESGLVDASIPESAFSRSVGDFLSQVRCRRPANDSEKDEIYRLRYAAYLKEGALPPGAPKLFKDVHDDAANSVTLGLHVEGKLSSSIRLHVGTKAKPIIPAMSVFSDILQPMLDSGAKILDPTRFVVDATAARLFPRLPYATVRLCSLAGAHFGVDVILATVRAEHQSFYKRLFGHKVICDPRPYPSLSKPISLMTVEYVKIRDSVTLRYPYFLSSPQERRAIFEGAGAICGAEPEGEFATSTASQFSEAQ